MSSKPDAKTERLPAKYEFDNFMMALSMPILWVALVQFAINTWRVQYEKWAKHSRGYGLFIPTPLHKIEVYNFLTGESCNTVCARLVAYGIPYQRTAMQWELWPGGGGIGMRFTIWLPGPQWELADLILAQYQGPYIVESRSGKLRGYQIGKPWGAPAAPRSFDGWILNQLSGGALDLKKAQLKPVTDKTQQTAQVGHKRAQTHKTAPAPSKAKQRPNGGPGGRKPLARRRQR